jgi:sterol desaturase/sphingolipid hydroxylase (fatty acid hydroxylase superfamily)
MDMNHWTLVFFGLVALLVAAEIRFPHRPYDRMSLKNSYASNVFSYLMNNVALGLLSASSLFWLAERYSGSGLLAGLPDGAGKWLLSFLLLDLLAYVWHWAGHHSLFLWMFHKVHHSDRTVNTSTAFRFHMGELLLTLAVKALFILVMGLSAGAVAAMEAIVTLFVVFHHANIAVPGEAWLARAIIVPSLHRAHHSANRREHDANYGAVFSFWDRAFATHIECEPREIGLRGVPELTPVEMFRLGLTPDRSQPAGAAVGLGRGALGVLVPKRDW